jgi:hypothetical protein
MNGRKAFQKVKKERASERLTLVYSKSLGKSIPG